jgi:hypothetical protein
MQKFRGKVGGRGRAGGHTRGVAWATFGPPVFTGADDNLTVT